MQLDAAQLQLIVQDISSMNNFFKDSIFCAAVNRAVEFTYDQWLVGVKNMIRCSSVITVLHEYFPRCSKAPRSPRSRTPLDSASDMWYEYRLMKINVVKGLP